MTRSPQDIDIRQVQDAEQLVISADTGARNPTGLAGALLFIVPLCWALFQLWYASPLPFLFDFAVINDTQARAVHLAFAIFLAFVAYPTFKRSPRHRIPWQDWLMALLATFAASYLFVFYQALTERPGNPSTLDLVAAVGGMLLLLEATRRALGPPLMIVAMVFLLYTFAGPYMPEVIAHKGASLSKAMSHQWLSTEGVFGVALGVSTSFVFLFVLFGALLDKAGAGNYFIKVAFALLGHLRGGPAKAAVVASGLSGLISGSSIANVVTTGTFTIPLMKRVGFSGVKAGAVEVAASTNGQLTPPIMGAAAFLMVEYVGISYVEVITHALLPALISYIALFYIVHLEALKAEMTGLPRRQQRTLAQGLLSFLTSFIAFMVFAAVVYYGIGWTKNAFGAAATPILSMLVLMGYIILVRYAAAHPELESDHPNAEILELPEVGPTVKSGLYFLLPIGVLVWCLMVERFSPGLSAFWATLFMIGIILTHRPLLGYFRKQTTLAPEIKRGCTELLDGLVSGARNMIGIGVATAAAGVVVGTVTLTGIGLVMTEFVEFISGGSVLLMLIFTALISLILGMGLPTTANYIVVSTLMAPVIVNLGAEHGLIVPLIAVHLFVFYFGILADDTPPVGLAAFAAAAISRSDPIKTGVQGFTYDIRTAILPFMFIFNTQLLLIGIDSVFELVLTVVSATGAMMIFAAATQGYWLVKSRWYESILLVLIAFSLFRPGFWWDQLYPPIKTEPGIKLEQLVEQASSGSRLKLQVSGMTLEGDDVTKVVLLPVGELGTGAERLAEVGLALTKQGQRLVVDQVLYGSPAQQVGLDFDWRIDSVLLETERPAKQLVFIPAILLLLLVAWGQKRRKSPLMKPATA